MGAIVYVIAGRFEKRRNSSSPGVVVEREVLSRDEPETMVMPDGTTYARRFRVSTLLLIGTDLQEENEEEMDMFPTRNGGQADFLLLLAEDDEYHRFVPILIDRDTMTEISVTNIMGKPSGSRIAQICLSYAFGTDDTDSCLHTGEAVSGLLTGVPVNHYMSLKMENIPVVNDAVGGVTVKIVDDLTASDPSLVRGTTVTLSGKQAEAYLRARMTVGSGTNVERMERQKVYMEAFLEQVQVGLASQGYEYLEKMLNTIYDVTLTDMSSDTLLDHLWKRKDYIWEDMVQIKGEHKIGEEGFMEFYPDENDLKETVCRIFYEKYTGDSYDFM
ncbi:MAG: LCP family protein [Blautia sp.]|nr:LCP family protein [Blautia sp.]